MTSVATTTSSGGLAGGGGVKQYTYKELEDLINKVRIPVLISSVTFLCSSVPVPFPCLPQWSIELQGQEKLFLQEAQQINSWDRLLAENGDKVWLFSSMFLTSVLILCLGEP